MYLIKVWICLSEISVNHNTIRWTSTYQRGRFVCCFYNLAKSDCHAMMAGVTQGSFTSPVLFTLVITTYPNSCKLVSFFVDDVHAALPSLNYQTAFLSLAEHAEFVANWYEERQLHISVENSHITLFTPDIHQYLQITHIRLRDNPLPNEYYPTILKVTLEPIFSFSRRIQNILSQSCEST